MHFVLVIDQPQERAILTQSLRLVGARVSQASDIASTFATLSAAMPSKATPFAAQSSAESPSAAPSFAEPFSSADSSTTTASHNLVDGFVVAQSALVQLVRAQYANDGRTSSNTDDAAVTITAVQKIRRATNVPLFLLTNVIPESTHVSLLDAGVDCLFVRPYSTRLLLAQVQAIARRAQAAFSASPAQLEHGAIKLDIASRTVQVDAHPPQRLSQLEFRLLHTLILHQGQVVPTAALVEHVWGYDGAGDRALVRGLVNRVRAKLEPDSSRAQWITTVPGVGYCLKSDVTD